MSMQLKNIGGYRVPGNFLNFRVALGLLIGEVLAGIIGFVLIEGYSLHEAWYMTIITISTVGYTEVRPLTEPGERFATLLILANIGIFAYLLSAFSYYVIQGEFFKKWHVRLIRNEIDKLSGHVIICGYGRHGREIVDHFMLRPMPFVVVETDTNIIHDIQNSEKKILYVEGDATLDETLIRAGIHKAKALITSLPTDADNVLVTISARQLNADIKITSRASDPRAEPKLQRAGANHVVLPEQIGAFFMATLVSKPGAIEFLSFMADEKNVNDIAFDEIKYDKLPEACRDKSLEELKIGLSTGTHIIGFIRADGQYIVNPTPAERVGPGSSLITLGTREQLVRLEEYLKNYS